MKHESVIHILDNIIKLHEWDPAVITDSDVEALEIAIRHLYSIEHVIITHPIYGSSDGWLDRERMLLFRSAVTCEWATSQGITWREERSDPDGEKET